MCSGTTKGWVVAGGGVAGPPRDDFSTLRRSTRRPLLLGMVPFPPLFSVRARSEVGCVCGFIRDAVIAWWEDVGDPQSVF